MNTKEIQCGIISYLGPGLAFFKPKAKVEIKNEDLIKILLELETGSCLLFDHRIPHSLSFAATNFLNTNRDLKCLAFLVRPGINEKIARFIKSGNDLFPVGLFYNEKEAILWLSRIQKGFTKSSQSPIELNYPETQTKTAG